MGDVEGLGQQAALFDMGRSCVDPDESGGKPSALQVTVLEGVRLGKGSLAWLGGERCLLARPLDRCE